MTTQSKTKHDENLHIGVSVARLVVSLILIVLGAVFLMLQADILSDNSNWWVMFLAIPGLGFFWGAYLSYQHEEHLNSAAWGSIVLGAILMLLTVIFIFDPQWSFFNSFGDTFPFLKDVNWDVIWPLAVVVLGIGIAIGGYNTRSTNGIIFGILVMVVGGIFLFDISWDMVWPFALIVPDVLLLFNMNRQHE